jgi:hypothetical protein
MLDITPAPEPPVDAREKFAEHKTPFGGNRIPIDFSAEQVAALEAAADELIPPGDGFPAPSEVGIVEYIARFVTPRDRDSTQFPDVPEDAFKADLDRLLGPAFVDADGAGRVAALQQIEADEAVFFGQLRNLVYYGYYSRREVVRAINRTLAAGRDYQATPQPRGYWDVIEPWDESLLKDVTGDYIRTEDAKRVVGASDTAESVASPAP